MAQRMLPQLRDADFFEERQVGNDVLDEARVAAAQDLSSRSELRRFQAPQRSIGSFVATDQVEV